MSGGAGKLIRDDLVERVERGCFRVSVAGKAARVDGSVKFRSGPKGPMERTRPFVGSFRAKAWQAMRLRRKFTVAELVTRARTDDDRQPECNATHYLRALVARECGVTVIDMAGERTDRRVTVPRHLAMYIARRMTGMSLERIGREFGRRNHTTVRHAVRAVEELLVVDLDVAARVASISARLGDDEERLRAVHPSAVASAGMLPRSAVDDALGAFAAAMERDPADATARFPRAFGGIPK